MFDGNSCRNNNDCNISLNAVQSRPVKLKAIQVNLIITLSLGSMETDHVISEPCYNEVIYNKYITK